MAGVCSAGIRAAVHPGDRSGDREENDAVRLGDPALRLLDVGQPPGCPGHLEVQVLLQRPRAGVLLHW